MSSAVLDVERARRDTPGCQSVIHLNNAGASLMPRPVLAAITDHVALESQIGGYEAAEQNAGRIEDCYQLLADLLNCRASEIAVLDSATRAWDLAFYSLPLGPGDRILTSVAEYASNYISFLQRCHDTGATVDVIPNDATGQLAVDELEAMLDPRVKLIAITHVPTNSGLVNPAEAVGEVARRHGILYLLDACQSVGQLPVDVNRIGCDILSTTGRKYLRGPRGTGLLYIRQALATELTPVILDLYSAKWTTRTTFEIRDDARRFESWESSPALKLGLGSAVVHLQGFGIDAIWERVQALANQLRELLAEVDGVAVVDPGPVRCGIVSFTSPVLPRDLKQLMRVRGINIWTSETRSTRLDMESRKLTEVVRASVHYFNTSEELLVFQDAVRECVRAAPQLT